MQEESIMGTTPIPRLIIKISIPLIISLLINSLYDLVDNIFISRVSEDALTGVLIAAPLQMLMIALGCGLAVGLNAMVSRAMGEKQPEGVKRTTSAVAAVALGAYLIDIIIYLLFVKSYFAWQVGGNEMIARCGISYMRICMLFSFGQMLQRMFDRLLIATGRSGLFLTTLGTASLVNVVLDPIPIFECFGFPAMKTAGTAATTVTGQLAGGLFEIYPNIKRNKKIPIRFALRIQKKYVANILKIEIPIAIVRGIISIIGIFVNTILYQFSSTVVAIYGVLIKVQNLAQIGTQGMNNGLIPIIAYNYGAGKEKRVHRTIRCAFLYVVITTIVVLISLELIPDKILALFNASEQMIRFGVPAVRIMSVNFFVSSVGIIFAVIFQGLGDGNYSMYLAFMRQVILLIPILLIGTAMGNTAVIWSGFAVAGAPSVPFGMWLYGKVTRNMIAPMAGTYGESRVETT